MCVCVFSERQADDVYGSRITMISETQSSCWTQPPGLALSPPLLKPAGWCHPTTNRLDPNTAFFFSSCCSSRHSPERGALVLPYLAPDVPCFLCLHAWHTHFHIHTGHKHTRRRTRTLRRWLFWTYRKAVTGGHKVTKSVWPLEEATAPAPQPPPLPCLCT